MPGAEDFAYAAWGRCLNGYELSELPFHGFPAVAAEVASGPCFWHGRSGSVAMHSVRDAILCAAGADPASFVCALLDLRQFGFAGDFIGICQRGGGVAGAVVASSGAALRAMPS